MLAWFESPRAVLAVTVFLCVCAFVPVLVGSGFDLTTLRNLRTVRVGTGGSVLETQYHVFAFVGAAGLIATLIAGCVALFRWIGQTFPQIAAGKSGFSRAKPVKTLDRELAKVVSFILRLISTNESYAKSIAAAQSRLGGEPGVEQVRMVVGLLLSENERMRRDIGDQRAGLDTSRQMVETLRSTLNEAEREVLQDPLTGVGNRRSFDIELENAIRESAQSKLPLALIMCDIDHFKRVNDTFGHHVGDEIIKIFSNIITECVREGDKVTRYGGEEFAVILPKTTQISACVVGERIRKKLETKSITIRGSNEKIGKITASFGVAQLRPGDDKDKLVTRADAKLYEAKSSGRNRVLTYSG